MNIDKSLRLEVNKLFALAEAEGLLGASSTYNELIAILKPAYEHASTEDKQAIEQWLKSLHKEPLGRAKPDDISWLTN